MAKCTPCENLTPRGRFRHSVTMKYKASLGNILSEGTDSSGVKMKAAIETLNGSDRYYANQRNPLVDKKVCVDYRSDINPDCWFEHGTKTYQIAWIDNVDERDRELQCYVTEKA